MNFIYFLGCIFLFFGLFWTFLPHIYHEQISEKIDNSLETSHLIHILEGLILTILGILSIEYSNRKLKQKTNYSGTKATKL